MTITFCDKCGKPLKPCKVRQYGTVNGEETIGVCNCGFSKPLTESITHSQKIKQPDKKAGGVLNPDVLKELGKGFPNVCRKCGHEWADVHDLGISYSDESSIHIFKCRKCGHTHRQAQGTGNR